MSVVALIRPDSWNFPLFLHVLGAMILVGGLLAGAATLGYARGEARFLRLGYWTLLAVSLPGWVLMRLGAGWIAEVNGKPAGYLLAVYVFSLEHRGLTAEIDEFFVLPGHRGSGLGARMLATAEKTFTEAGCTNVALQLGRGNDAARAFYRERGYAERSGYELLEKML